MYKIKTYNKQVINLISAKSIAELKPMLIERKNIKMQNKLV